MSLGSAARNGPAAPEMDLESHGFWAALRSRRIVLQRCESCDHLRFPPMPACPFCGAVRLTEVEVSGRGRVYSYVRVHRALTAAMRTEAPYVIAVVQLDEGPRIVGRIEEGGAAIDVDAQVIPRFVEHGTWTELRFDVADAVVTSP